MTGSMKYSVCTFLALLLFAALPAGAAFRSQCPTQPGGSVLGDLNGDGYIRFDQGEISSPVSLTQVCVHLAAGDGFINMADKSLEPNGHSQYIFGFSNKTWTGPGSGLLSLAAADAAVGQMWDMPGGSMLGANFAAPSLTFKEGDDVYLSLSNVGMVMRPDLFDAHSVHWHGFPQAAPIFDGEPMASTAINMGSTLTYYYKVVEPGTFFYHCHVEASEHMQMGMLGNLHVTPALDALGGTFAYNDPTTNYTLGQSYPIQISAFDPAFHDFHINVQPLPFADMDDKYPMLNGRGYPDTINPSRGLSDLVNPSPLLNDLGYDAQRLPALITAAPNSRILLRIHSVSTTSFHTITTLGIPMQVVGTGARVLRGGGLTTGTSLFYTTNSITLGGGEAYDVILDTTGIAAGTYFLYSTNLQHLNNDKENFGGMMTEIVIQ